MSPSLRRGLALAVLAALPAPLFAQQPLSRDLAPERPLRKPTRRELDHLEAVKLYGLAAHHEYENRLPEALRTYEKALRLDPDSAAIRKAMIPLYLALDRRDDGLACCRKVLELEPGDFETRYLYSRQLLAAEREADARAAARPAAAVP